MSERSKSLPRPKVRFSQDSDSANDSIKTPGPFHGPRIREIVTLKKPVLIIRPEKDNDEPEILKIIPRKSINIPKDSKAIESSRNQPIPSSARTVTEKSDEIVKQLQERKKNDVLPQGKLKNHQNVLEKLLPAATKSSFRSTLKSTPNLSKDKCEKTVNTPRSRERFSEQSGNKENFVKSVSTNKGSVQPKKVIDKKPDETVQKPKTAVPSSSKTDVTKAAVSQVPKNPIKPAREMKKNSGPKIPVAGTMACMKIKNIPPKNSRKTEVKKTLVRNSAGPLPKVYVGPGIIKNQKKSLSDCGEPKEIYQRPDVLSADKLKRPEYNSIVSTMKNLEDIKKKKVVNDVDSLPPKYRNLVMGKVSSALDFAACESVYKDLVDLSISEDQLPKRFTRSKDPEPRQRDITPKLSDFFVPEYIGEYPEAATIRPRTPPPIIDNWNAFRISDKINEWKNLFDQA